VTFDDLSSDRFIWRWTTDGTYSASSAYRAFFVGMATLRGAKELWKVRAPPKCKFFFWLLLHDRLWTAARRKRHGLQDDDVCIFCDQEQETARHLAGECVYSHEVWYRVLAPIGLAIIVPPPGIDFLNWWLSSRAQLPSAMRNGFDSLVILGCGCSGRKGTGVSSMGLPVLQFSLSFYCRRRLSDGAWQATARSPRSGLLVRWPDAIHLLPSRANALM
jgi:hypothetical protein